ncbi:MAG: hypothetical protein Q8R37_00215 [Nanoarchaeota archaeon]|nr:hypothetical protein [Nanoarchaeota archaeon]
MVKITIPRFGIAAFVAGAITATAVINSRTETFPPALSGQLELLTEEAARYCNRDILILEAADVINMDSINMRKEKAMTAYGYNPDCVFIDCRQTPLGYRLEVEIKDCYKK